MGDIAKHTPGPWMAEPTSATGGAIERVRCTHPTHPHVADVAHRPSAMAPGNWESPDAVAETEANACLIAAAPELLDALLRCVQRLEGDWEATQEVGAARAAIAKATGGAK